MSLAAAEPSLFVYSVIVAAPEPLRFVKVTDVGITAFRFPCMVSGCVNMKMLPNSLLAGSTNQLPKTTRIDRDGRGGRL